MWSVINREGMEKEEEEVLERESINKLKEEGL